jgi:hypothetical protein
LIIYIRINHIPSIITNNKIKNILYIRINHKSYIKMDIKINQVLNIIIINKMKNILYNKKNGIIYKMDKMNIIMKSKLGHKIYFTIHKI